MYKNIVVDEVEKIGIVKLNRPKVLNVLNKETLLELREVFWALDRSDLKVIIITGEGKAFSAGADIKEMQNMTAGEAEDFSKLGQDVFSILAHLRQPTIAAINGVCLGGGCELALACDLRIMLDGVKIGQPEVKIGCLPGWGGSVRLPRIVGPAKAKEMIFTGEMIDAGKAYGIGLVNMVVSDSRLLQASEDLMFYCLELGRKIAANSSMGVQLAKEVIDSEDFCIERELFGRCFASGEAREGMTAFLEKREPNWNEW